jgi:ATP-dependent Clp protease ATP-binding subunit ClpB
VAPAHLAFALLNEEAAAPIPGGVAGPSHGNVSLFTSAIQRAGGDPTIITRGVQRLLVRLPAQSPPPEETSLSSAALKILREAKELQTTMHDSVSDPLILN